MSESIINFSNIQSINKNITDEESTYMDTIQKNQGLGFPFVFSELKNKFNSHKSSLVKLINKGEFDFKDFLINKLHIQKIKEQNEKKSSDNDNDNFYLVNNCNLNNSNRTNTNQKNQYINLENNNENNMDNIIIEYTNMENGISNSVNNIISNDEIIINNNGTNNTVYNSKISKKDLNKEKSFNCNGTNKRFFVVKAEQNNNNFIDKKRNRDEGNKNKDKNPIDSEIEINFNKLFCLYNKINKKNKVLKEEKCKKKQEKNNIKTIIIGELVIEIYFSKRCVKKIIIENGRKKVTLNEKKDILEKLKELSATICEYITK